jgi:phosphatidylserine/phosphatidylglycerophosphate/cardiolipin synthase-like enzyme
LRKYVKQGNFSVNAISGTYVIMLGLNAVQEAVDGLLGFAIHRTDHTEDERYWLKGFKTFEETEPDPTPGAYFSTLEHPVQSFLWSDYTAKADHKYTYKIVPLFGKPKNLQQGSPLSVEIEIESEDKGTHAVYFNRGVAASQAYARKFQNKKPDEVEDRKAYIWLSRGLEEAMLRFISQADSSDYGLRASVYEFNYLPILQAFKKAADGGADVKIIYDARKETPRKANEEAIKQAGIKDLTIKRTECKSYISHNKFILLLKDTRPIQVWTGSTNFTRGGIFGQSNVGHTIRDETVASKYYEYWLQLLDDPTCKELRNWTQSETPDPDGAPQSPVIMPIFSPRKTLRALEWYTELMDAAKETVCLTAAFGVNSMFAGVLSKDKDYLRYLLLERKGNNFDVYSKDPDTQVAIGSKLSEGALYRWTREVLTNFNFHVKYVHNKFMLIDPLSDNPTVITGSANFSNNSTLKNDENMLVIHGDTRVADIYLGEFARLFHHFYFRYVVNMMKAESGTEEKKKSYLKPDDSWTKKYFESNSIKEKQRTLFGRDIAQN